MHSSEAKPPPPPLSPASAADLFPLPTFTHLYRGTGGIFGIQNATFFAPKNHRKAPTWTPKWSRGDHLELHGRAQTSKNKQKQR